MKTNLFRIKFVGAFALVALAWPTSGRSSGSRATGLLVGLAKAFVTAQWFGENQKFVEMWLEFD